MIYAEELGFDGVCVNEHHQTAYGLMPAPNLIASILARQTKRVKIAILGNARRCATTAEDRRRGGDDRRDLRRARDLRLRARHRLRVLLVRHEPAASRERFDEAVELILRAWREHGPFSHYGKHYRFRYVNAWPSRYRSRIRRLRALHRSAETLEWATRERFPFIRVYDEVAAVARMFDDYRERAARRRLAGGAGAPGLDGARLRGETDDAAREQAAQHILYLFRELTHRPMEMLMPPGYSSPQSMARFAENLLKRRGAGRRSYEDMQEAGFICFGSAETVRQRLTEYQKRLGFGKLVSMLQFGSLPADLTRQNMDRFARDVMPDLRGLGVSATPAVAAG